MAISRKLQIEIEVLHWFIPSWGASATVTEADIQAFISWSSRGTSLPRTSGTDALRYAKTYREYFITLWRSDIRDGLITVQELLADMPVAVRNYVSKSVGAV